MFNFLDLLIHIVIIFINITDFFLVLYLYKVNLSNLKIRL